MKKIALLALLVCASLAHAQSVNLGQLNHSNSATSVNGEAVFLEITTGSNPGGYTISSCSFWNGHVAGSGNHVDCGLYTASSDKPAVPVCGDIYTTTGSETDDTWQAYSLPDCTETLTADTKYFVSLNTDNTNITTAYDTYIPPAFYAFITYGTSPTDPTVTSLGGVGSSFYLTVVPVSTATQIGAFAVGP